MKAAKSSEELRKEICSELKLVDRRTLKTIKAILVEALAPSDGIEEQELLQELDKRVAAYKTGKSKLLTVEEVKARYLKRKKKRES